MRLDFTEMKGLVKPFIKNISFEINFDKLAKVTGNHQPFINKVKELTDEHRINGIEGICANNIKFFFSKDGSGTRDMDQIGFVMDIVDTYIVYLSCSVPYREDRPGIVDASYNKLFISQMAKLL